jgi:hypothetical protein
MFTMLILAILVQAVPSDAPRAFDASTTAISAPRQLVEIDTGKWKGEPVRLVLEDDGRVFVRMAETDRFGNERGYNYIASSPDAAFVKVDEPPDWSIRYWSWKAGWSAPGLPQLKFEVESSDAGKVSTGSTSQATGVDNPNRSDPSSNQIAHDMASYQKVTTTTVKLKGQVVFRGENRSLVPGLAFGWAPAPLGALAFVDAKRRLVLVDRDGRKKEVDGAVDILLPGWTNDGTRVYFLQKRDRKRYGLMMVDVR